MAVTVGTDVYLSVADADTYWSNRNNSVWAAATTAAKEAGLREATQYLDARYEWVGIIAADAQTLGWPRTEAYDREGRGLTGIPAQIESATAELALEALDGRLVSSQERGGMIKREKAGAVEVEYMDGANSQKTYDYVSMLLTGLGSTYGNRVKIIRV